MAGRYVAATRIQHGQADADGNNEVVDIPMGDLVNPKRFSKEAFSALLESGAIVTEKEYDTEYPEEDSMVTPEEKTSGELDPAE